MNIGIDIRTLMDSRYSGVSLYTYELVREIIARDRANSYKLFYNSVASQKAMPKFTGENVATVHTRWPNKIFNYFLQKGCRWPKIDRALGVDLFFMPHINFIALSSNCRKVITIHDLSWLRYRRYFSARQNLWHKLINIRRLLNSADIIIAVSDNTKKDIMELVGINEERIKVIYSGISDRYQRVIDSKALAAVREKYHLPEKFILFLGTIEPRKNISGLVKAYELLPAGDKSLADYYLVIAGSLGRKSDEDLKCLKTLVHRNKILLPGYVAEEDKPGLYSLASLFVYPSFYEGFGFPPLEALACGCPVITSSSSSLPEIIGDDALLVDPYNIREISQAMVFGLKSESLKNKALAEAKIVHKRYDWRKTAAAYLEIFNNSR